MRVRKPVIGALAAMSACNFLLAEVGVIARNGSSECRFIVVGIGVDPNPHLVTWVQLMSLDHGFLLNPNGDTNGDGAPSFGSGNIQGFPPTVTWARQVAAGNHDPVYSQFINGSWTAPASIATAPGEDLGPRWYQDAAGTIHAAWWRADPGGSGGVVLYAFRAVGSGEFSQEEAVSLPGEAARNPSLAVLPTGEVLIAYETDPVSGGRRVVIASKATLMSAFQPELVQTAPNANEIFPELRTARDHVWVTWLHSDTVVGYSARTEGVWFEPAAQEPCLGPDDAGRARVQVVSYVLSH